MARKTQEEMTQIVVDHINTTQSKQIEHGALVAALNSAGHNDVVQNLARLAGAGLIVGHVVSVSMDAAPQLIYSLTAEA